MTTFLDLDPLEEHLNLPVSQMDNRTLFKYTELYHLMSFEHSLKDCYPMAFRRIQWLRQNYDSQAGDLIKWVWYRYDGLKDGQKFTFSWFTDKQMWWVRRLQGEMAGHRIALLKKMALPKEESLQFTAAGFMTGNMLSRVMTTAEILSGGVSNSQSREQVPH